MNEKDPISSLEKVQKYSIFLYLGSMFLPAAEGASGGLLSGTIPGLAAYLLSYLSFLCLLEEGGLLLILGCMSNIIILLMALNAIKNKWLADKKNITPPNKKPSLLYGFAVLLTICSVCTWYFGERFLPLYIGYYVWAIASIGIVGSAYLIKLKRSQEEIEDASH